MPVATKDTSFATVFFGLFYIPINKFYNDGTPKICGFHDKDTGKRTGEWQYFDKDGHMEKYDTI